MRLVIGASLLALFVQASVASESMRCGTHVIQGSERVGISKFAVVERCGEPTARYGNHWVYARPGMRTKVLRFGSNGQLQAVTER